MQEDRFHELIAKELGGECNSSERAELQRLIKQNPEYQKWHELYKDIWSDTKFNYKSNRTNQSFEKISENINEGKQYYLKPYTAKKSSNCSRFSYFKIAAVLLFLIVSAILVRYYIYPLPQSGENNPESMMMERIVPKGQKLRIYLPDGSTVWLNAESRLIYPKRFDTDSRTVFLDGEGYFEVEKDASKPFTVKTNRFFVTALGTSFDVRVYSEHDAEVALNSGKVLVRVDNEDDDQVILEPGQGVHLPVNNDKMERVDVIPEDVFMWKDGVIYFKDATFSEVTEKLSRWYGVTFEVKNYNGDFWEYSASFKDEYLRNILESMSYTKDFVYQIDNDKVYIEFKNQK